jgi:regulation of enolase protein 1 (concanavalin A-like superfamily)
LDKQSLFKAWSTGELDQLWWWLREEPTAWSLKNNALYLRTLPGTLWGTNNTAKNILLRPEIPIESGLTSEVTVTNKPAQQAEQAGLIWFNDEANYVKLVKESLEGAVWIVLAREQADNPTLVAKIPMHTDSARLRLTLTEHTVVGWAQPADSDSWLKVGECALVNEETVHLGVFTHGGPVDEERWVTLRKFHIYK